MVYIRPRQRLTGGRIVVVMTRWSVADLTGKLQKHKKNRADQWEVIEFLYTSSGKPLWRILETRRVRSCEGILAITKWNAQYQQVDRRRIYIKESGGKFGRKMSATIACIYTILRYGVREKKHQTFLRLQPGACFISEDGPALILVDSLKERLGFPGLRRTAKNNMTIGNQSL